MKFKEMTFTRGATINRGNFNSERIDISATVEVPDGEDHEVAYDKLKTWVTGKVQAFVKATKQSA